jgi:hypothetical protein
MAANEHPYRQQPAKAFWKKVVGDRPSTEIRDWYQKKWNIADARVATAGSCFAQHIGARLRSSGFRFVDVEPTPRMFSSERAAEWGFGIYSARYGNVYTTRQLLQLLQRATGEFTSAEPAWAWNGGFVDPFRPTIEPQPMVSIEEVQACQKSHLASVLRLFKQADVFVFTLGLTEGWLSREDGSVFPVCPGIQGGTFDASRYAFINFSYPEVLADLEGFISRARQINPKMKFLLTVSPVPLMATATQDQVVVASMYSKSVLRAVAGFLAERHDHVDYFPSYEIISSHVMKGQFYSADMRGVERAGVEHVMRQFFSEHVPPAQPKGGEVTPSPQVDNAVCDEELLAAFGAPK